MNPDTPTDGSADAAGAQAALMDPLPACMVPAADATHDLAGTGATSRDLPLAPEFQCYKCGAAHDRWTARCGFCRGRCCLGLYRRRVGTGGLGAGAQASTEARAQYVRRVATGWKGLDQALGGDPGPVGLAEGSRLMLWGAAGLGKTRAMVALASRADFPLALYVNAEMPPMMFDALMVDLGAPRMGLYVCHDTDLRHIRSVIQGRPYGLVVVDSVSVLHDDTKRGDAGSVAQIQRCAARLVEFAIRMKFTLVMGSHLTSEGRVKGGTFTVHGVDTTLSFEGTMGKRMRYLRVLKNRFGPSGRVARLRFDDKGRLREAPGRPSPQKT